MALLLDTHTFLRFIDDDPRLSATAQKRISDPAERVLVSLVSLWEIVIKLGTGKLSLDHPLEELWPESLEKNGIEVLNVTAEHALGVLSLPLHHKDPFDRLSSRRPPRRVCRWSVPIRRTMPTRSSASGSRYTARP